MAILVSRVTRRSRFGSSLWRRSAYAFAALPAGLAGVVRRLVYCDAYVPEDGQSCWDLTTDAYRSL
ncbi:hypothetical protein AB0C69_25720, partial [Actinomadura sp. NPDC048032]|uniref:hypothetical protein n=1 Tax=Actinomadura sp. NPDC048032 TaxID=3155747 RepID=UPI0033D5BD79